MISYAHDDLAVRSLAVDLHRRAARGVLHRVVENVEEELRQPIGIAAHRQGVRAHVERDARLASLHVKRGDGGS